ncbi:hypothetical protein ACSBR1_025064 [Camellia fascicularis]
MLEVIVETDSTSVEVLPSEGPPQTCPFRSIVDDSPHLIRRCNCTIRYILREGNKCVDLLANMGADQMEHLVVVDDPPAEVWSQIVADMIRTAYCRI